MEAMPSEKCHNIKERFKLADITLNTRIQLRNDTESNWLLVADTAIPLSGEICITNDGEHKGQFKIGDGVTTWGALPYANSGANIQVDASQVMFSQDLVFTEPFGKYSPDLSGRVTVPADGDSLLQVLLNAYATDSNPSITQPSVNISSSSFQAYEVGTNVTPSYTATLNAGSYQYGPATGITPSSWEVKDTSSNTLDTASGSFPEFQVIDNTNYSITATATYKDGAIPLTALGQEYAAGQIKAGSKSATKGTITGYRNGFYGTSTSQSSGDTLISNAIRGLSGKSNRAVTAGTVWNISIPVGALSVIFAYPATIRDVTSVLDANGLNAEIKTAFTQIQVQVAGANGYNPIEYKVYYTNYANANDTQNTYKVTI